MNNQKEFDPNLIDEIIGQLARETYKQTDKEFCRDANIGVYISEINNQVYRVLPHSRGMLFIGNIKGVPIYCSDAIGKQEAYKKQLEHLLDKEEQEITQKEKVVETKIIKSIKITFNDGTKVEWKDIAKYRDVKGNLQIEVKDNKVFENTSSSFLQLQYDFEDIKTYTITNKVVKVEV